MTTNKTYNQLYWDKEFVEKRIREQEAYLMKFVIGVTQPGPPIEDRMIYNPFKTAQVESAKVVLKRFERQLENINKLL